MKQLDDNEIEQLRVACKLGREVLDEAYKAVAVGVTTDEIDRIGRRFKTYKVLIRIIDHYR